MAITVEDLIAQPHLRLELLAGSKGIGNVVTWAHSSDLAEPWDWLAGGEMLMRNGRTLPRAAKAQVALLDGLAAARASALVIGLDLATPPVTRAARAHADELGLPLMQVPYSMSFIVLSRAVADATRSGDDVRRIARAERIYSTVHAAVAGSGPAAFFRRLEADLECQLFALDKSNAEPVLAGTSAPDRQLQTALLDALAKRGGLPLLLRLPVAGRRTAVVVEVPYEEPTLLVAVSTTDRFDVLLLQHAAAATAIELAHLATREHDEVQAGSELLRRLLDSPVEAASLEEELTGWSLDPATATLLALRGSDPNSRRRLQIALKRRKIAYLLTVRGSLLFLLVGGRAAVEQAIVLASERMGASLTVGVSGFVGSALRAGEAAREATWMLSVAEGQGERVGVYGQEARLPVLRNPAEAATLVERVLGPILVHDREHHGQLVESLRTFLTCRRSPKRTAAALSVHRQTVVYRMNRVQELTGRSLSETADLAELWMALTALELMRS